MNRHRWLAGLLLGLWLGAVPQVAVAQTPKKKVEKLSWKRLVAQIEATNPLMKAAKSGVRAFEAQLSQAKWARFPSFKLESAIAPSPTITGDALKSNIDSTKWGYFVRAEFTMILPIYTFGKIGALKRAAKQGVAIGQALVETARWELRHRAAQAYYGALLAKEIQTILVSGKKWLKKAHDRMETLRRQDDDSYDQNEHLRLRTRVSEFYALEAQNNQLWTTSHEGLRLLASKSPLHRIVPADKELSPIPMKIGSADFYWKLAQKHSPIIQRAQSEHRAMRALHAKRKADLLPDLVFIGSATAADSDAITDQPSVFAVDPYHGVFATAAIGLRWNLDLAQRILKVKEAAAKAQASRHQATLHTQKTELKIRQLVRSLKDSRSLIDIYAKSRKAAQGWLMASWDLYEDGFGEFRTAMEALVQYYRKRVDHLQAIYKYNTLVFELSAVVGHDLKTLSHSTKVP